MATVPQRELRNNTAELLRRVERGERLIITVQGHPVADSFPSSDRGRSWAWRGSSRSDMSGLLPADDRLDEDVRELMACTVES